MAEEANGAVGGRGPPLVEANQSAQSCRRLGLSCHVSSVAAAARHTAGSMSATTGARKRGKSASGIGAGAGPGMRRRKVSCDWAGYQPRDANPGPSALPPQDPGCKQLGPSFRGSNPGNPGA